MNVTFYAHHSYRFMVSYTVFIVLVHVGLICNFYAFILEINALVDVCLFD